MPIPLEDYRWLISEAAAKWLSHTAGMDKDLVQSAQLLRKDLSQTRAHLVLQQWELRRRAAAKFSSANQMFFTPTSLEQATDEQVARHKALKFIRFEAVADLCCGIGGDLLALGRESKATGVDACAEVSLLAEENCRRQGIQRAEVRCDDATQFPLEAVEAWHIDPDRRPAGARTSQLEFGSPDVPALARMVQRQDTVAIKMAPAAIFPPELAVAVSCEWIQSRGECRQQVAWLGEFADAHRASATLIDARGVTNSFTGDPDAVTVVASQVGRYCYEPSAAVLAARLTDALAAECQCQRLTQHIAYLTSDADIQHPMLSKFQVVDCLPFDQKQLRRYFRHHGIRHVEVKKRGVRCNPAQLQKQLAAKAGDAAATLIIAPHRNSTIAIVAKRVMTANEHQER